MRARASRLTSATRSGVHSLGSTTLALIRRRGVALGLAIVSELVELHGGRRRVEARDGGGVSFIVELPASSYPTESDRIDAAADIRRGRPKIGVE